MKIVIFFLSLICSLEINLFQKYDDNVSIILFYQRFQRFLFDVNIENICWQEPTWHRYVKIYLMAGEKVRWESLFGNFLQNPQTKIIHWASLCEIEGSSQFGHCKHFRSALVKARLKTLIWDLLLVIKCIVKISVENEPRSFRCPHSTFPLIVTLQFQKVITCRPLSTICNADKLSGFQPKPCSPGPLFSWVVLKVKQI